MHPPSSTAPQPAITLRSPLLLAALAAVFLGAVDLTIIATILPTMIGDLGINTADVDRYIWIVNGYLIAYIVAIPLFGRLSDVTGRVPVFAVSLALFAIGAAICALADSLSGIVVGRTLQGAGGGALLPAALALAADSFSGRARLGAVGVITAVDTLGWVTGPLWGAAIVASLPNVDEAWRWVFWLHLPFAAICALALFSGQQSGQKVRSGRARDLDLIGALLLAAILTSLNLAVSSGSELGVATDGGLRALGGTPNPLAQYAALLLLVAAVATVVLVVRERRSRAPLLPIRLFRVHGFAAGMIANLLLGCALMVGMVNIPTLVALVVSPDDVSNISALMLAPFTLCIAAGSLLASRIAMRLPGVTAAIVGVASITLGYIVVAVVLSPEDYVRAIIGLVAAGLGFGIVLTPLSGQALAVADASERGAAASLAMVARLLGMTLGISALTAIGVRRLQELTDRVEPVTRGHEESTAAFLERQRQYIEEHAVPLAVQVLAETFWIAAVIAALALIPLWFVWEQRRYDASSAERNAASASATD